MELEGEEDMDKWFDNLTDSRWFMKMVALVLALLLFVLYTMEVKQMILMFQVKSKLRPFQEIPVKSYYDTENLVVSGVPETVEVTVKWSNA